MNGSVDRVIAQFLSRRQGNTTNKSLSTDGTVLRSYDTTIAYFEGAALWVNHDSYNATTTRHVNRLFDRTRYTHIRRLNSERRVQDVELAGRKRPATFYRLERIG